MGIRKHHAYCPVFRIRNPVLPDTCPLVQVQLHKPVMPQRGGGQDFYDHVRCPPCTHVYQLVPVTYDGDIRLHRRVHILRLMAILLKKADTKGCGATFLYIVNS